MPDTNGAPKGAPPLIRVRPGDLILTEEDDPRLRPTFPALLESMREHGGNTTPIFVGPADTQGRRKVYEGNSRACGGLVLGLETLLAIEVPDDLDELGLIDFSATHNGVRRMIQPEEWAAKAERIMELTGCTQEQAARRLRCSPTSLSRWMSSLLMPEKHREVARKLVPSVRCMIAGEQDSAVQDRLIAYATTPGPDGKLPPRDAVLLMRKRLRGERKRGPRKKALRGTIDGRDILIGLKETDATEAVARALRDAAAKLMPYRDAPPESLGFVLR